MRRRVFASRASSILTVGSLASALRSKSSPLVLNLEASEDLQCRNLLCEKVGEPCICRMSHVLESLTDVRELYLAGNHLTSLPASVWQLRKLVHLDLSRNRLKSLPQEVANLEHLEALHLEGNEDLQDLPQGLHRMQSLKVLKLPAHLQPPQRADGQSQDDQQVQSCAVGSQWRGSHSFD